MSRDNIIVYSKYRKVHFKDRHVGIHLPRQIVLY